MPGDSASLSGTSLSDEACVLREARDAGDGKLVQRCLMLSRRKAEQYGAKEGLDKVKVTSVPQLKSGSDYGPHDAAIRTLLRGRHGGYPLLLYAAYRAYSKHKLAPSIDIANPNPVPFDATTATSEENRIRADIEQAKQLLAIESADDDEQEQSTPAQEAAEAEDYKVFEYVVVYDDAKEQWLEGATA